MGVTAKLFPNENNDDKVRKTPIINKKDGMLKTEYFSSISFTIKALQSIAPNQYGLCIDGEFLVVPLQNKRVNPITILQKIPPILTIVRNVLDIINALYPTMARFKKVRPKAILVK